MARKECLPQARLLGLGFFRQSQLTGQSPVVGSVEPRPARGLLKNP